VLDESGVILFLHGGVREKAKHTDRRQACREKYTAEMYMAERCGWIFPSISIHWACHRK